MKLHENVNSAKKEKASKKDFMNLIQMRNLDRVGSKARRYRSISKIHHHIMSTQAD